MERRNNYLRFSIWRASLLLLSGLCLTILSNQQRALAGGADDPQDAESHASARAFSGAYCGVACLYSLIRLNDRAFEFSRLLKPEYVGSLKGSSLGELRKAAQDNGLYAEATGQLTKHVLLHCPFPIILHVKSSLESKAYDHYVLFLGVEGARAKIVNPPRPTAWVPLRELAARWDGSGLIVSAKPIAVSSVFAPAWKQFVSRAGVGLAVVILLRVALRRMPPSLSSSWARRVGFSVVESATLGVCALTFPLCHHFVTDEGLLVYPEATQAIQRAHAGDFIPRISARRMERLVGRTPVVDARLAGDYRLGHLKDAISLPVDANDLDRRESMSGVPKDAKIVVYCQSAGCKFAERVAIKLVEDGCANVAIFRGGWVEWIARHPQDKDLQL